MKLEIMYLIKHTFNQKRAVIMKTVIYCRVGNKSQTSEGQKELCMKALESDDELVGIFDDVGCSGLDLNRPMLLQLMEGASKKSFLKVITSEPTILFRDALKVLEFEVGLEQLGIKLKYAGNEGSIDCTRASIKEWLNKFDINR